jgi:benzoyl-CoA reductase/2-hydroxyglutaryl-CoA dehydratase subunit BcrC/BadD/HgdB
MLKQTPSEKSPPRAIKTLKAAAASGEYQKKWFAGLRSRVAAGEDFAYLNADVPMEIFRAMDIPFAVNQWWAAICAAKQKTSKYYGLIRDAGYRDDLCSYCATAFAESMDPDDAATGPWGGLPKPTIAITRLTCDCQGKIFELFAKNHGADLYLMENTLPRKVPEKWWELAENRWEELYEARRLDAAVDELKRLIAYLEIKTRRMFDNNRLIEVMRLVNEQESWYKKTRDLIAESEHAPVTVVDTINATMQAQWQRGTPWAAEHARAMYEEIKALRDSGHAAVPNEKYRLMWLGRGLWHDFAFYQNFEAKYGAAFVWSMYLAMGADAYIRSGIEKDPLRALAARYIGMEDFLHMPPWNSAWFLSEAKQNRIDGVVYMAPENCMQAVEGSSFIIDEFEKNGIPVLLFRADPVDSRKWNRDNMTALVEDFIENRIINKQNVKGE